MLDVWQSFEYASGIILSQSNYNAFSSTVSSEEILVTVDFVRTCCQNKEKFRIKKKRNSGNHFGWVWLDPPRYAEVSRRTITSNFYLPYFKK